jgi:hypothetical protein
VTTAAVNRLAASAELAGVERCIKVL